MVINKLLSTEPDHEKIEEVVAEMNRVNLFPLAEREEHAKGLIRHLGVAQVHFCAKPFDSPEDAQQHKQDCEFRPVGCVNDGCPEIMSARWMATHDNVCTFKIVPCVKGCRQGVRRMDMASHLGTSCPNEIVPCTFLSIGCQETLTRGQLGSHLTLAINDHLAKAVAMILEQDGILKAQNDTINSLVRENERLKQHADKCIALHKNAIAREESLEKEVESAKKTAKGAASDAKDTLSDVKELRKWADKQFKELVQLIRPHAAAR